MSAITYDHNTAFTWQLRLPTFEGPLDVLLRLIEKQQLPITEISLALVSDQFLQAARELGGSAPETVAEFTAVGSRLVAIKARSLIPRPPAPSEEDDEDGLVVQLLEYKAIKEAARQFAQIDKLGMVAFSPSVDAVELPDKPRELPLGRHEASWLARALQRKLAVVEPVRQMVLIKPVVSLREMIGRLSVALTGGTTTFETIARSSCADPSERRALFLALLVMIRRGAANAQQDEPFGEIAIERLGIGPAELFDEIEEF
ncbi:MAG: segregation/condensation protein A [Thermomicrobiales bacterium]|nr:MAG: segregation/condensation protein A [Thermomicrobiales bacterium]